MKRTVVIIIVTVAITMGAALLLIIKPWDSASNEPNKHDTISSTNVHLSDESRWEPSDSSSEGCVISEYLPYIESHPIDKNVGAVDDKETAIEKAKELWVETFSDYYNAAYGRPFDPNSDLEYGTVTCDFDYDHQCWHVYLRLPPDTYGDGPHAIIREDGQVLDVWLAP